MSKRMTYCYYQGQQAYSSTVACLLLVLLYLTGLLTRSTYILTRPPPVRDGSALRRLGRRKAEEARFPLVTVHYCTVLLGWMLCLCPYTGTSLVPYRKLPTTVTMNTESSPVSTYSNLASCNSTGLLVPEPKTAYTFE